MSSDAMLNKEEDMSKRYKQQQDVLWELEGIGLKTAATRTLQLDFWSHGGSATKVFKQLGLQALHKAMQKLTSWNMCFKSGLGATQDAMASQK